MFIKVRTVIIIILYIIICNKLNAQSEEDLQKKGYEYILKENYRDAIQKYSEAIRLYPNSYINYELRGMCNYKLKEYQLTINDMNETEKILSVRQHDDCLINYYRGSSYFELGNYYNALQDLLISSDCYQVDFDNLRIESKFILGIIYQNQNDCSSSINILEELKKECSSCEDSLIGEIYYRLSNCYVYDIDIQSDDNSKEIIRSNFSNAWAKLYGNKNVLSSIKIIYDANNDDDPVMARQILVGEEKESAGYFRQAIEEYDLAITVNPYYLKSFYNRGKCYFKIKDYKNALNDLLYYSMMRDYSGEIDDIILECANQTNNQKIAITFLNYFLEYYKDKKGIVYKYKSDRAYIYYYLKEYKLAIKDFKELLKNTDSDIGKANIYSNIGICYAKRNKTNIACKYYKLSKKYGYKNADVFIHKYCK